MPVFNLWLNNEKIVAIMKKSSNFNAARTISF
jgi:hypothetical protein